VAKKGQELAKGRRLGGLKAGLSGEGDQAALAIRALLAADPNNAEAKKAFEKLLEDARQAAKKADDKTAGEKLRLANLASGAPPDITSAVEAAVGHLSESRHAEAEKGFSGVDAKAAKVGFEVSKLRRQKVEQDASAGIAKPGDPRPFAAQLKASLIVEPSSKAVAKAFDGLVDRAKKTAVKGADVETAQILEALAILENGPPEAFVELTKASALYGQGAFEEAEGAFGSANGETDASKIALLGRELARKRRIALLEAEWKDAQKAKDVLRESASVQKILALEPAHAQAKAAEKRLGKQVGTSRLDSAKSNREMGKLGVAFVYLERALAVNEQDSAARAEMEAVRKQLEEKMDLILLVEPVTRAKEIATSACLGFDEMLREEVMGDASKRTDLGAYVLSAGWTKAVEEKSDKAPDVSGGIALHLEKCATTPASGKVTFSWTVKVPRGGDVAAKAEVSAELEAGIIPREERDEAGNNAKMALADRAGTAFLESFEKQRDPIDIWMLALAEHAITKGDVALAADAYARIAIKRPSAIDPERMKKVEAYLERELR
jgi:tetratricopeptide (TPR) repeat protein